MTAQEQHEYNASRGDETALARLDDDGGCSVNVPLPRRPFVGLRKQQKKAARDSRPYFWFFGEAHIEVADGVYVRASAQPELWSADVAKLPSGEVFGSVYEIFVNFVDKKAIG